MLIHYYKQFFPGPEAAGSRQPRSLVKAMANRGHQVHVIACDFNGYTEETEEREEFRFGSGGQVDVHRLPASRNIRSSLSARLKSYVGFAFRALRYGSALPPPDLILASVQPLFTAWTGRRLARTHRVPWVLEVRDLWPDALEAKGAIRGWQAYPLHRLANSLYRDADRIVSVTPGIKLELMKKGLDPRGIDVFPNGFDPELFRVPPDAREEERARLGWGTQFVALYTGTHTEVTAIETIVRAANELRDHPQIRIDLFGYGQTKPKAMALATQLGLSNIHFHDPVPKTRIPLLLEAADVGLMSLFRSPLIHIYFENKLMDYMGAGKPILAAMEGQQAELLERAGAGRVVPAFDHVGLARLILEAWSSPEGTAAMGQRGREVVHDHLLLPAILRRYVEVVEAVEQGVGTSIPAWEPLS